MPKSTTTERRLVKNIVAILSIERIPEQYIMMQFIIKLRKRLIPYCPSQSRF
jgi:hypothetical protein